MFETSWPGRLSILKAPYRTFVPTNGGPPPARYVQGSVPRGMALVWNLGDGILREDRETVQTRPYGMALVAVLPPAHRLRPVPAILDVVDQCRPQSILPHHRDLRPEEIARVLRRPPADLASELIGYLSWRGVEIEHDTRHLVRRTIELSAELRSVAALSRAVYLSRRALGRRLCRAKLPVPSHWLHFGRLLRIAIQLQNSDHNLFRVGCEFGYSDGFSLSNQMSRIIGIRPSTARDRLGWEWIAESWLQMEASKDRIVLPHGRDSRASESGESTAAVQSAPETGEAVPSLRVAESKTSSGP